MTIGFDLISDLNLSPDDNFNWENKATSLYCIVPGNISSDIRVVSNTLNHLAKYYQGIFYTPGYLEFQGVENFQHRLKELIRITNNIKPVVLLYHHVVMIDGIAVLGCTGSLLEDSFTTSELSEINMFADMLYLKNSIIKLQKYLDVKKIMLVTNGVPSKKLYFGEEPKNIEMFPELSMVLLADSEMKVSHWIYGSYGKIVDTKLDGINYVCNPYTDSGMYWAKRIDVEL